jgi:type II secretory pathway predicted ATPase ExeA
MYKHFFGLRENPFNVNPDPRFLYLTPQTREALDELTYGIQARKGLVLLTGEVGTGKTTLLNRLLDWLHEQQTPTAFIFNSHLEISHLFDFIMADFGVPFDARLKDNALMRLNQWLFERYRAGDTPVIIVDEAQGLPDRVLEEIRMLLNLETPGEKLLQIVLAGQPELEARLERPELRQVKQRITLRCKTAALSLCQTHEYIHARLHIAGANGKPVFASEAMDAVHFYSRGIPRVINLLCEHALINAYVDHLRPVPAHMVAEVAREFQFDDIKPVSRPLDTAESLATNLIFASSIRAGRQVAPAIAAESRQENLDVPANRAAASSSAPFIVLSPSKEPARPDLDFESILDHREYVEPTTVLSVPSALSGVPGSRQIKKNPASDLTQFLSEIVNQSTPRMAVGSAPEPALPPFHVVETRERLELLRAYRHSRPLSREKTSAAKLNPTWIHRTVGLSLKLKQFHQRRKEWYRRCLSWRSGYSRIVRSMNKSRTKEYIYRWLSEPLNPSQWHLPESWVFEARRRLSYKKL